MANIIGIDLGTTYSAVAHLTADGRAEILRDDRGHNLTPSVVFLENDDQILVGWEAKKESAAQPTRVAEFFKRQMGTDEKLTIGGHALSPIELSAIVLKKIKKIATDAIGRIDETVITVPANFTNQARSDTISAAREAGLDVKFIVNEPTAAAIYYAQQEHVQGKVAIYDLGGGTFDCSIVEIIGQDVEILSSQGNQRLGGYDIDNKLLSIIQKKFTAETGSRYTLKPSDFSSKDIEELKKSLSSRLKVLATVSPPEGGRVNISVTREEFENSISTLITQAEMLVETALSEINLEPDEIDHVVLVGGSTRIPMVQESVKKLFKQEPKAIANVDEAVALGAAIYAAVKSESNSLNAAQKAAVSDVGIAEITNHFFGTIALNFAAELQAWEKRVSILIQKNTPLPCEVEEIFQTVHDGQTAVRCSVTQSPAEETDPRWVTKIWEGDLGPLPPGRPAGQQIAIKFSYDVNQIVHCRFTDIASGKSSNVSLDLRTNDPSAKVDIDQFLVE